MKQIENSSNLIRRRVSCCFVHTHITVNQQFKNSQKNTKSKPKLRKQTKQKDEVLTCISIYDKCDSRHKTCNMEAKLKLTISIKTNKQEDSSL